MPSAPQTKTLDDGLYVGLGLGYDSYRIRSNLNTVINGTTATGNPTSSATGFVGGIFGGYGEYFRDYLYLGGEAFVNIIGASSNTTFATADADGSDNYNSKLSVGTSFGLGLLPGLKLNDSSLFYLRLGGVWANFKNQESAFADGLSSSTSDTSWIPGLVYGLGLETAICNNFSLRTEYTHTDYNKSGYTPFGTRYSPYNNQFMLGLIYHVY